MIPLGKKWDYTGKMGVIFTYNPLPFASVSLAKSLVLT